MDAQVAAIIIALLINVPTWIMLKANSRKVDSEAESSDATRRKLEDEITVSVLKRTEDERQAMIKRLDEQDKRISEQERRMSFWVSFARANWEGSRKLHAQLVRLNIEPPEYTPLDKFPTGPLGAVQ